MEPSIGLKLSKFDSNSVKREEEEVEEEAEDEDEDEAGADIFITVN